MSVKFHLSICFVQILILANAMEDRDHIFEPFLSISLPYSVKRGEVINVPVKVYNYLHKKIDVVVTLDNSDAKYENIDFHNKVISDPKPSKSIEGIRPYNTAMVYFLIRPKVIGKVTLKVNASYLDDFDITYKTMNVVPEGITYYSSHSYLFDFGSEYKERYFDDMDISPSRHKVLGFVNDIMNLILNNLDNLVRMSTGCGEKTMSSVLPSYLVMKYLKDLRRLTPTIKARLRHTLETGYQKILDYHRMDGSFSSLGLSRSKEEPRDGSTFLTSYVLRFLPQFKEFININETIIEEGLAYLSKQQTDNGSFIEEGDYFYDSQRNPITLTGAAVLAFLENPVYADKYLRNITKGLEFIGNNHETYKLLHIHALDTYGSNMAKHVATKRLSLIKWLSETSLDNQSKWWHYMFLSNVEITSNNLLLLLDLNSTKIDYVKRVIKRRTGWRKSLGFASTQKTVASLTNLIEVSDFTYYEPAKMEVNIMSTNKNEIINLNADNGILYKSVEFPPKTKIVEIIGKGKGTPLVDIAETYDVFNNQNNNHSTFTIFTKKLNNTNPYLKMLVCLKYVGTEKSSNMTLLEISTPSGYVIVGESLKEIEKIKTIINAKLKNSDSLLFVYFDHLYKNDDTCLMLEALRTHAVAMQKPGSIQLYDYYDEGERATAFYDVDSKLCDICVTEEECSKCK